MEWVPKYVYLGSTISGDGDESEEIKKRLAIATNKLSKLKFLWNGQDPQARLRIHRTCVFPSATYMAVRHGHLEKQLYKELMLLK